jgi:gamma-D-glutamyl-L-lysine dipeptidyl-peptidase
VRRDSLAVLMIGILFLFSASIPMKTAEAAAESCLTLNKKAKTYINVSAATFWKSPGISRKMDRPSLTAPADLEAWTSSMKSVSSRIWLTGKTETQALYGQEVKILQTKGNWVQAAVTDQATSKNKNGYPGWMPKSQTASHAYNASACPKAVVKTKTAGLHYLNNRSKKYMEVSYNTSMPVLKTEKDWILVQTPLQPKWMKNADVEIYEPGEKPAKPAGKDLVSSAKSFLGLPYLWAGTSAYGFDCSGLTYSIYKQHGILLPRDASEQFKQGTFVLKSKLQPGDLIFFGSNGGKGKIHHVAMYAGNGSIIHSPKAGKNVEIIPLSTPSYSREYAGARRYIQ